VLHDQLVALCDTYVWYLLRRQQRLPRAQAEHAVAEMVTRLLS
jgi:hypothetical protein